MRICLSDRLILSQETPCPDADDMMPEVQRACTTLRADLLVEITDEALEPFKNLGNDSVQTLRS